MPDVNSTLEKLKKLDAERSALLEATKKGILESVEVQLASLRELGFEYEIVQSGTRSGSGRRDRKAGMRVCSICHKAGHNSRTCTAK